VTLGLAVKGKAMEKCYEYLGCTMHDCVMYGREDDTRCWEVEETLCSHPAIQRIRDKLGGKKENACARGGCIYYRAAKDGGLVGGQVAEGHAVELYRSLSRSQNAPLPPAVASRGRRRA